MTYSRTCGIDQADCTALVCTCAHEPHTPTQAEAMDAAHAHVREHHTPRFPGRRDGTSDIDLEPCGRGICAANAGHEGTCEEASGFVDWTPEFYDDERSASMTTDPDTIDQGRDIVEGFLPAMPDQVAALLTRDVMRALADAGLLRDSDQQRNERMSADATVYAALEDARAELELWRTGQRRKFWPKHPDVPDAMRTAANLARAQTGEDEAHDSLLREAAVTIKALHEGYGYAVAERDKAQAERNIYAAIVGEDQS